VSAVGTRNVPGSLGKPIPGVEIAVARPLGDGETPSGSPAFLPAGEEGELLVRGQNVFMGYVSRSDDGLCMHDGWLRTGDLVVRDADGVVWFRGVTKPMFTHNGFNIYPREIARAVRELEGVERVVVRAVPDPAKEHLLVLEVSGRVTAEDVKQWCERRLAAYKQPAEIRLVGR
jgi:acyl-CoA synthetase (AMP-forming)/AMP-acid ligase II